MEQRQHPRYIVWLPVKLGSGDDQSLGVTHNVSQRGILLVSNSALTPGESIQVTFKVAPLDDVERTVIARILRVDENTEDPDGLWPYRLALEFDEPVPELESLLANASVAPRESNT